MGRRSRQIIMGDRMGRRGRQIMVNSRKRMGRSRQIMTRQNGEKQADYEKRTEMGRSRQIMRRRE